MFKIWIALVTLLLSNMLWSFPCKLTVIKDSCWQGAAQTISIDVVDSGASKPLVLSSFTLPQKDSAFTQVFECKPSQILTYRARIDPPIWEQDKGKNYLSKASLSLPATINPGDVAWDLTLCFSESFSSVPLPTHAIGHCQCDFSILKQNKKK